MMSHLVLFCINMLDGVLAESVDYHGDGGECEYSEVIQSMPLDILLQNKCFLG